MMKCTICAHPRRKEIEAALGAGQSNRRIAAQFGIIETSLRRHKKNCIAPIMVQIHRQQQQEQKETALDVYRQLGVINSQTIAIATEARRGGMHKLALEAFDRILRQLEFQAKLLREKEVEELAARLAEMEQQIEALLTRRSA